MRVVLIAGKGGVGKTTVAAATALASADAGNRTLVTSTDPAHSLADVLGVELPDRPAPVATNLCGQQLDPRRRLGEVWQQVDSYLTSVLRTCGADALEAEELAMVPGLDEILSLSDLYEQALSGRWDVIIVDCAPTAETLRLLRLPSAVQRYLTGHARAHRRWASMTRKVSDLLGGIPLPTDEVLRSGETFLEAIAGVASLLSDRQRCWVRLVTNPERTVVAETKRTFSYLTLFHYHVDAIVVNRVAPPSAHLTPTTLARQGRQIEVLRSSFGATPLIEGRQWDDDLIGLPLLRRFGRELYGEAPPDRRLGTEQQFAYEVRGPDVVLTVPLPGLTASDIRVRREDPREIEIRTSNTGASSLTITIADSLVDRAATASYRDGQLELTLEGPR